MSTNDVLSKLKAEIESRMGDCDANSKNPNQLLWAELAALIPFIDSLQKEQSCDTCTNDKGCVTCKDGELWEGKEQPSEGYDEAYLNEKIAKASKTWKGVDVDKYMAEMRGYEQPSEDLGKAAEKFVYDWAGLSPTERRIAERAYLAGAEWQKEQMGEQARKELAKTDITLADIVAFDEGLKLGRRLERQDMLKDAVEGVLIDILGLHLQAPLNAVIQREGLKEGDKVKIVIVKED